MPRYFCKNTCYHLDTLWSPGEILEAEEGVKCPDHFTPEEVPLENTGEATVRPIALSQLAMDEAITSQEYLAGNGKAQKAAVKGKR